MSYSNYTGSLSGSGLNTNVAGPMGTAFDNWRAAHSSETDGTNQEKISDTIAAAKFAMRAINNLTGEPQDGGIKPVSGSTTSFVDIAEVVIFAEDLESGVDPALQNLWITANDTYSSCSNATVLSYLGAACTAAQSGLAGWAAMLDQPDGAGDPPSGGTNKGDHH